MVIDDHVVSSIRKGLVVLIGVSRYDTEHDAKYIARKVPNLRVFSDQSGKFSNSSLDVGAELLIVSQFTLYGDVAKGRRPSFIEAASPDLARILFDTTVQLLRGTGLCVETGQFQSQMSLSLCNEGPVTIMLDSKHRDNSVKAKDTH